MLSVEAAQAAHDQATAALDDAKALVADAPYDDPIHEEHRPALEAAYAAFHATSKALVDAQIAAGIALRSAAARAARVEASRVGDAEDTVTVITEEQ